MSLPDLYRPAPRLKINYLGGGHTFLVNTPYTKAITQLASDKLTERLGGSYALEHLMAESARDHDTIVEVLAAFIRESASAQLATAKKQPEDPPSPVTDLQAESVTGALRPGLDAAHPGLAREMAQDAPAGGRLERLAPGRKCRRSQQTWIRSIRSFTVPMLGMPLSARSERVSIGWPAPL
ncbi:MAG TPA: hypothetical protein VMU51_20775 [Mycobacteriales bacterium]|nr:hypothetical protein [Mycobacteriales bacterium]